MLFAKFRQQMIHKQIDTNIRNCIIKVIIHKIHQYNRTKTLVGSWKLFMIFSKCSLNPNDSHRNAVVYRIKPIRFILLTNFQYFLQSLWCFWFVGKSTTIFVAKTVFWLPLCVFLVYNIYASCLCATTNWLELVMYKSWWLYFTSETGD